MNKIITIILVLCLIAATVVGIVIGGKNYFEQERYINEKTVLLGEAETDMTEINLYGFTPGTEKSYTIHLKGNESSHFDVKMSFEKTESDSLAQYLDLEILVGDTVVAVGKLADFMGGKKVAFGVDFDQSGIVELKIIYRMAVEIGDEAQGTTADFHLILVSKR